MRKICPGAREPSRAFLWPLLLVVGLALAPDAGAASATPDAGTALSGRERFVWQQAGVAFSRAESPGDFREVAATYRSLLDADANRPGVLENYGVALLLAGAPDEALDAFRRAERLGGSSPDLRHDIRAALVRIQQRDHPDAAAPDLPWMRVPFFWHYELPFATRCHVALAAWLAGFAFLPFAGRGRRLGTAFRTLSVLALVVFAAFFTSAMASVHQDTPIPPLPPPAATAR